MKTFGLIVPRGIGAKFEANVRAFQAGHAELARIILPRLEAWRSRRIQATELGRQLLAEARKSQPCQLLMSISGVGDITATAYLTAVEDPANFIRSGSVGAWLGLTTRRYQSGEVDYNGHINVHFSQRGDTHIRLLLHEAAAAILTRSHADSDLRSWGMKL